MTEGENVREGAQEGGGRGRKGEGGEEIVEQRK